jgi:hypothetical protein
MKIVHLPLGNGLVLDGTVAVVSVNSAVERVAALGMIRAALGDPGDTTGTQVELDGMTMPVTPDVKELISTSRNNRRVVFAPSDLGPGWDEQANAEKPTSFVDTIRSALDLNEGLSLSDAVPPPISSRGRRRISELKAAKTQSSHDSEIDNAYDALTIWRNNLVAGYHRVDEADRAAREAEAAADRKLAGPAAFNRFLDLKNDRDRIVRELGFSDFETFTAERQNLLNEADRRLRDLTNQMSNGQSNGAMSTAELTILELHRDIDHQLQRGTAWGVDSNSMRARHLMRQNLRNALARALGGVGIECGSDQAIAEATHWLGQVDQAEEEQAGQRFDALATHIRGLAFAKDIGPIPAVLTDLGASFDDSGLRRMASLLRSCADVGQQVIFVERADQAARLSNALASLASAWRGGNEGRFGEALAR